MDWNITPCISVIDVEMLNFAILSISIIIESGKVDALNAVNSDPALCL